MHKSFRRYHVKDAKAIMTQEEYVNCNDYLINFFRLITVCLINHNIFLVKLFNDE